MPNFKNDLEGLEPKLISRAMKTLIYIFPMFGLTVKIYTQLVHNDAIMHVGFNFNAFMSNLDSAACFYSIAFFALLYLFCYYMETIWLPAIICGFYEEKWLKIDAERGLKKAESIIIKNHGENTLKHIHVINKGAIIEWLLFWQITILFWSFLNF